MSKMRSHHANKIKHVLTCFNPVIGDIPAYVAGKILTHINLCQYVFIPDVLID